MRWMRQASECTQSAGPRESSRRWSVVELSRPGSRCSGRRRSIVVGRGAVASAPAGSSWSMRASLGTAHERVRAAGLTVSVAPRRGTPVVESPTSLQEALPVATVTPKVAIIYYSSTGTVHALAQEYAKGLESAGAEVRLRKVHELAPPEAIASNEAWAEHAEATKDVPEATA